MKLNEKDYLEIASRIEEGSHRIEYEKGEETLYLDYVYETDGYIEDDFHCGYMNGTGAWVETSRILSVERAETTDIEGQIRPVDVDERLLESLVA